MVDVSQYNGKFHLASEPAPHVLLLEFNRAPANAFHDAFWMELEDIINRVSANSDIRVIVVGSRLAKFFTAGLDVTQPSVLGRGSDLDAARRALAIRGHLTHFQRAISTLELCTQPVICAMHGFSLGLAIDLSSACDIRLCSEDAKFGIMEVKVGLAADIGTLQRFPKIVGSGSKARELALTGREFNAAEAKEIGFVSEVVPGSRKEVLDAAVKMASTIAMNSPIAVVSTKHLMNHARDHSVQEGLDYTAAWNQAMLQSEDTIASMKARLAKKTPVYKPIGAKL